jgi:hypothetical protein
MSAGSVSLSAKSAKCDPAAEENTGNMILFQKFHSGDMENFSAMCYIVHSVQIYNSMSEEATYYG